MSGDGTPDPALLLRIAIERAGAEDLARWAATGIDGIRLLRELFAGVRRLETRGAHSRDDIDNMSAAVAAIASAHPAAYVGVFGDRALDGNAFVLIGLGQVDDPRATAQLAVAARSHDSVARMHAAIGLGRRRDAVATEALVRLLSDRDDLVRHHALSSLVKVGDQAAVAALKAFDPRSDHERSLAADALSACRRRVSG